MSSSNKRFSINDISLPNSLMKGLSIEVLKDLNKQDEATFYQYFEGLKLEEVKRVREKSQQIRDGNKALAGNNLELEPKFSELKGELLEKTRELGVLKEEYDKRLLELKAFQNRTNHHAVEKELVQATRKTEQDSENMAADFIGGKSSLNLAEFEEKFMQDRTLYWLRKVKVEKMKELLLNYRPTPSPRTARSLPTSTPPAIASVSSPPYPGSSPMQSLPAQHQSPGYPVGLPTASLPPYPPTNAMPAPQKVTHPFAYTPYPNAAPARPPPYAGPRFNQHRF